MKIDEAKKLIKTMMRLAKDKGIYNAIEIVGGPGMGKSEIIVQAAEELSYEFYGRDEETGQPKGRVGVKPFFLTTVEPPDVRGFGLPSKDKDGRLCMDFTIPPWAVKSGDPEYGILFLDEKAQASHDVQKPAAELLLNRRVGSYQLPPGWIVVAASNRESDRSGVQRELAFVTNRRMLIQIEPSLDAWVDWAERIPIHPLAIAYAKYKPGSVFADKVPEKAGPFCTPRTLVMLSKLIGEFDMGTFTEIATGLIGEGTASEFVAFLRVAEQLPKFEDIIADPTKVAVPNKPDANYATMQMIAHRIDDKNAKAAFTYLKRMGQEFQVAGLRGTFRRCPALVHSKEFGQWLRDNKELVMAANLMDKAKP